MNDTPRAEGAPEFPGRETAVRLGAALLAALFLVLVLVWRDNGQRTRMETTAELTAVGDAHYFSMPSPLPTPPFQPVASLRGEPLYPADFRRHEFHPDDMTRIGLDEKGGYILYKGPIRRQDEGERQIGSLYFLKISPTEYFRIRGAR
jgi:hypothetical protein